MGLKQLLGEWCPNTYEYLQDRHRSMVAMKHAGLSETEQVAELARLYKKKTGHEVNFSNPRRYTEKIQWRKMFGLDSDMSRLSDKYAVRKWVAEKIGSDHLIPLIGAWESADEIDFAGLPRSFVLKTNNASGTNIIVPDCASFDVSSTKRRLDRWLNLQYGWLTFEKQYLDIKPMVIAEQYMKDDETSELIDYKFLCFDGVPRFVWVDCDRLTNHKRAVFDTNWNLAEWNQYSYGLPSQLPQRPASFDLMLSFAKVLCEGFPHVRVDFYVINGQVYFGEMTFTNGSGFERIEPDEFDFVLGDMWNEAY